MSKPLCIYHGNCDDGFASAWVVRKFFGDGNVDFFAGDYSPKAPRPEVKGRDLILVDFSYKRSELEKMCQSARSILILDHHKTAQADLEVFGTINDYGEDWQEWFVHVSEVVERCTESDGSWAAPVACLFDMDRSGAGITWDFFNPGKDRPLFIDYIQDRDLWHKKMPGSDLFVVNLRSFPQDFAAWDAIIPVFSHHAEQFCKEGEPIQRYYRKCVEDLKKEARPGALGSRGWYCNAVNAPYAFSSEVAGELADADAVGVCWRQGADGLYHYSLRSRGDQDVSEIAKEFGGGGHKGAAGFSSKEQVIEF